MSLGGSRVGRSRRGSLGRPFARLAAVRRVSVIRLVLGPRPAPDRILLYSMWFRGHNNPVVAELIERMQRVDACLIVFPARRILRGVLLRAYRTSRPLLEAWLLRRAAGRYCGLFSADTGHIERFPGSVVMLMDDVLYSPREVDLLNRPNVKAYFVTRDRAGRRYAELGVTTPYEVIPQAVPLGSLDRSRRDELIREKEARGVFVVGYHASFHLSAGDRGGGDLMYNVDHLLELWDGIRECIPNGELWLVGTAGDRLRERCAGRTDIVLFGRKPRDEYLAYVAAFDVGLYPRASGAGVQAAKLADYLGVGVPVVAYDYDVVRDDIGPTGAGILAGTPAEFVDAVVALAGDPERRRTLAAGSARAGAERDWAVIQKRYAEVLDRYLLPATTP